MQLVIHAPFGGRINRAWGLALRKRFCRTFDFELQAAATDDGIVLSLGPQHSFPLDTVFSTAARRATSRSCWSRRCSQAPMFETRWRWNATRALALLRLRGGKRVPPPLQRMRAPRTCSRRCSRRRSPARRTTAAARSRCPITRWCARRMRDCLDEAMDVDGPARACSSASTTARSRRVGARHARAVAVRARDAERATRTRSSTTRRWRSGARAR